MLMCVTTLQDGPQVELMEWNRWRCRETHQHAENATFFEGVQHAFLNSHCDKTIIFSIFHKSQWKRNARRCHHDINKHVANAKFSTRRTSQ